MNKTIDVTKPTTLSSYSNLSKTVGGMVGQPQRVFFSIFDNADGSDGEATENTLVHYPDLESTEPVINGVCRFSINNPLFSPSSIISSEYTNPTWKDIILCANNLLGQCELHQTGFLHDIIPVQENIHEFAMTA